jgi:hypothetical protein
MDRRKPAMKRTKEQLIVKNVLIDMCIVDGVCHISMAYKGEDAQFVPVHSCAEGNTDATIQRIMFCVLAGWTIEELGSHLAK